MKQEIRFCTTADGVRIAYAISGSGPPLVKAANWLSHLEFDRDSPVWRHWLEELSLTHTLIRYDERGCGLSDRDVDDFSFEAWVRDLETVVEAAGCGRFDLLGLSQGGPVAIRYVVCNPERVKRLVLYGSYARGWKHRQGPEARSYEREQEHLIELTRSGWGRDTPAYRQLFTGLFVPEADPEQLEWFNELQRISTSPENAARFQEEFGRINVTEDLGSVPVPTLVLHARRDARCPFEAGRELAAGIPDSRFVALESRNHILLAGEPAWRTFLEQVREFLGVSAPDVAPDPDEAIGSGPGSPAEAFLGRLRRRKVGQWGLAYVAAAWVALQAISLASEPWRISDALQRALQVGLAAGLPVTLVLAWYHGDKGRQKVSGTELFILALLLAIAGTLVAVLR